MGDAATLKSGNNTWVRHGFLNVLEHGFTRGADALVTIVLLWGLPTEIFSKLALAQALVAPILVFYISPGWALYYGFSSWKIEGPSILASRLRALRLFGWGLGQFSVLLALLLAFVIHGKEPAHTRFFALVWAFGLAAGPHLSGADREFLRMELKLRELNWATLYQKSSLLAGVILSLWVFPNRVSPLALVMIFSMTTSSLWVTAVARRVLRTEGASEGAIRGKEGVPALRTLTEVATRFSLANHVSGVILNWVQTLDVFMLGAFRMPAIAVGLYATALKIANMVLTLPVALGNTFAVWIGRGEAKDRAHEMRGLFSFTTRTVGLTALQAAALILLGPGLVSLFSHGRWSREEQTQLLSWMRWILAGGVAFSGTLLMYQWAVLRSSLVALLTRAQLPWLAFALICYAWAASQREPRYAAMANLPVGMLYLLLMVIYVWRSGKRANVEA